MFRFGINDLKIRLLCTTCLFIQVGLVVLIKFIVQQFGTSSHIYYSTVLLSVFVNVLYAVIWQHVLAHLPLSVANSFMSLVPILTLLCGVAFFGETASLCNYLGISLVLIGLVLIVSGRVQPHAKRIS